MNACSVARLQAGAVGSLVLGGTHETPQTPEQRRFVDDARHLVPAAELPAGLHPGGEGSWIHRLNSRRAVSERSSAGLPKNTSGQLGLPGMAGTSFLRKPGGWAGARRCISPQSACEGGASVKGDQVLRCHVRMIPPLASTPARAILPWFAHGIKAWTGQRLWWIRRLGRRLYRPLLRQYRTRPRIMRRCKT